MTQSGKQFLLLSSLVFACNGSGSRASGGAGGYSTTGGGGFSVGGGGVAMLDGGALTGEGGGTWAITGSGGTTKPGPGTDAAVTGTGGAVMCEEGVVGSIVTDCGYPYASSVPLTSVTFNESEVLRAIRPSISDSGGVVTLLYGDEHALTLGVRQVVVTDGTGSTPKDYAVTPLSKNPDIVLNPQTGTNDLTGDYSGLDPSMRPLWPVLYITDVTKDPLSRAGDWQYGGRPYNPTAVYGTWKSAVRAVDKTTTPATVSVTPDADPAKNDWNLGIPETIPSGVKNEGYSAEVKWSVGFVKGHSYRIQVMVHDGDQNKVGGDSGEACIVYCAGGPSTNPPPTTCPNNALGCSNDPGAGQVLPSECPEGTSCFDNCCTPLTCPAGNLACSADATPGTVLPENCPSGTSCVNGCCVSGTPVIP